MTKRITFAEKIATQLKNDNTYQETNQDWESQLQVSRQAVAQRVEVGKLVPLPSGVYDTKKLLNFLMNYR